MSLHRVTIAAALALALGPFAEMASADSAVVRAGRLLDVEQGRYLNDQAIRIEDGRIASISPWSAGSRGGARLVDWSAYSVLPGLIDLHTHLVGDISSADVALRNAINAGQVVGPRMYVAGAYVTVTNGGGADFIKIIVTGAVFTAGTMPSSPEYTEAEIRVAVEEAAKAGTFVAAHAHGAEGIKNAVKAGARIGFGTDAGIFPHGGNARQFEYMMRHGMTPLAAIGRLRHVAAVIKEGELVRTGDAR